MKDIILTDLVKAINTASTPEEPIRLNLTLMVNGMLLSGTLISYNEYLNSKMTIGEKKTPALGEELFAIYKNMDENTEHVSDFLHLKDITIVSPSSSMDLLSPIPMRIRLDSISGFLLGGNKGFNN